MRKILVPIIFFVFLLFVLTSCLGGDGGTSGALSGTGNETETPKNYYRVMVALKEGFSVTSENPIEVEEGTDAVFNIEIAPTHAFVSVSEGAYDPVSGKLTVPNVTKKLFIDFEVRIISSEEIGKTYEYVFCGTQKDTTSIASESLIPSGTPITVTAGDKERNFIGWSFGSPISEGGRVISSERVYTFSAEKAYAGGETITIYSNYSDANKFYYDLSGGTVNVSSSNMSSNDYYVAEIISGRVQVTLKEKYYKFADCASTFWDDGTFTKDGYVLREYNTKPDGSGEAYSLGSKYSPYTDTGEAVLYCIWEKADDKSLFEYGNYSYAKPSDVKYDAWTQNGIIIKKCNSSAEKVVIPEKIDGKDVIAIASGAFTDCPMQTLVLPKTIKKIEDGAFVSCASLSTLYFPDGVYSLSDAILDSKTYASLKTLVLNATIAPRYCNSEYGAFAVKLCRVLSAGDEKMIIFVAGSSTYQGLGTEYLEALLLGEYRVVNYGTTRTRPGYLYMEALAHYTDGDDIMIFAPENSAYMLGENIINKDMLLQLEGVNNFFRYIDISKYEGYFSGLAGFNAERYAKPGVRYEAICDVKSVNKYGDHLNSNRAQLGPVSTYKNAYYITFNERIKSIYEGVWSNEEYQAANKDYTDESNVTWTSLDRPEYLAMINAAIDKVKATGAKVYFSFAPADERAIVDEAKSKEHIKEYDELISSVYNFDGLLGSAADYVYDHKYFYDCAYHVNDYGRTYRTYMLYCHLGEKIGIDSLLGIYGVGTDFEGCLFENGTTGTPLTEVGFLK